MKIELYLDSAGAKKNPIISELLLPYFGEDVSRIRISGGKGKNEKGNSGKKSGRGSEDTVLFAYDGLISIAACAIAGKLRRLPVVIVHSFPFLESLRYNARNFPGTQYRSMKKKMKTILFRISQGFSFRRASSIIVVSPAFRDFMVGQGYPGEKIHVQPMGAPESFLSHPPEETGKTYDLAYLGSHDLPRQLDRMLETIAILKEKRPGIRVLMLGEGTDKANLISCSKEMGLEENIDFIGPVEREYVPGLVSQARIGISHIPPTPIYEISSPTKLMEYLALGLPVVANRGIPDQEYVVEQSGGGLLCEYSPEGFAAAVEELLSLPDSEFQEMGSKGREWIGRERSYSLLADGLRAHLEEVIARHR